MYQTDVQFLCSVEPPVCKNLLFINQGLKLLVFKIYSKLLLMFCLNYEDLFSNQTLLFHWEWNYEKNDCVVCLVFFLSHWICLGLTSRMLECNPLAHVACSISPVPVLNCELLKWRRAIEKPPPSLPQFPPLPKSEVQILTGNQQLSLKLSLKQSLLLWMLSLPRWSVSPCGPEKSWANDLALDLQIPPQLFLTLLYSRRFTKWW